MRLKVATWNLNCRQAALRSVGELLRCDVALLQEVPAGHGALSAFAPAVIDGTKRRFGTAVHSPTLPSKRLTTVRTRGGEFPLSATYPGCAVALEIVPPETRPITVISLYGALERGVYAITTVHRMLSDLTPLLMSRAGSRVVVGGDLNCTTQLPPPWRELHRNLFERFRVLGLVNLTDLTKDRRDRLSAARRKFVPIRRQAGSVTFRRARRDGPSVRRGRRG